MFLKTAEARALFNRPLQETIETKWPIAYIADLSPFLFQPFRCSWSDRTIQAFRKVAWVHADKDAVGFSS